MHFEIRALYHIIIILHYIYLYDRYTRILNVLQTMHKMRIHSTLLASVRVCESSEQPAMSATQ